MIRLAILQTHHYRPISMAAILDVFESANAFYQQQHQSPFFDILQVTDSQLATMEEPDMIMIPAFTSTDMMEAVQANHRFIPWLQQQYQQGTAIASFCTGAFLLAATGLLNGRKATTHVMATNMFTSSFPEVLLQKEAVVTYDGNLYTSGGATCSFHLMLYLLEKYCGREIAVQTAKMFSIDMDRQQQTYFAGFQPIRNHNDVLVKEVQQKMEKRYMDISTVDTLIREMPMSPRNFMRRFKQATGITPIDYLQQTRIEAARRLLEHSGMSTMEIMCEVGYGDMKSFRNLFTRITGLTPKAYREKYALAVGTGVIDTKMNNLS